MDFVIVCQTSRDKPMCHRNVYQLACSNSRVRDPRAPAAFLPFLASCVCR